MGTVLMRYVDSPLEAGQLYHDNARLEGADGGYHLHYQDLRLLLDTGQFHALSRLFDDARAVMDSRKVDLNGDDFIASTVIDGSGYDPSIKIEKCQDVYHFHYRGFRLEFSESTFAEFIVAMKQFIERLFPLEYMETAFVSLPLINPYDHIHKASFSEWIDDTTVHSLEHLVLDYHRHLRTIQYIKHGILHGRQIRPILLTLDPEHEGRFVRRDGFCRYKACEELGFEIIPAHIVTEDVALTQPQHGANPFLV
jgi:hypothetical protein